jgi:hypothetical protein
VITTLTTLGAWLYANVFGNIVASLLAFGAAWFWKVRPHFKAQRLHREAEAAHREVVCTQLAELHKAVQDGTS